MEYNLYPPYFVIEPQTSFSEAWEVFCCHLLNLEYKTKAIHRRIPPDRGIDLFWQAKGIAYQCKAVESGLTRDFHTTHVKTSLKKAQEYQNQIGWQKYTLCTNVDLTGPQIETLQQMLPDIDMLFCNYWIELCRLFHETVADRFRLLIPVAPMHVQQAVQAVNQTYRRVYLPQMQKYSQDSLITLLLYLNKHKHIFEFSIPSTFTAYEVLLMLRELFELPGPKYIREQNTIVYLEHSLHVDGKEVAPQQRLSDLPNGSRPLVTLWKTIIWSDNGRKTQTTDLEAAVRKPTSMPMTPLYGPERIAIEQYTEEIDRIIDQTATRLNRG